MHSLSALTEETVYFTAGSGTRIIPLPSMSMPVSWGIDAIISELDCCGIDTMSLRHTARKLDSITSRGSIALQKGEIARVYHFLEEAIATLREAHLTLKLMCITERNHLPGYVFDHLTVTREIIEHAMEDARIALGEKRPLTLPPHNSIRQ